MKRDFVFQAQTLVEQMEPVMVQRALFSREAGNPSAGAEQKIGAPTGAHHRGPQGVFRLR